MKENKNFMFRTEEKRSIKYFLKLIYSYFYTIIVKILLIIYNILSQEIGEKKFKIAICGIFKNEAKYLEEWIEYHLLIGVEHFYLYNNFSEDNYLEKLSPYIEKKIVTLIEFPMESAQGPAYKHCYKNYRDEAEWICFLDIDEFICLYEDINIREWLKKYKNYPSVMIYWKMFGSSGKIFREKELIIEEFYLAWEKITNQGKSFFNTKYYLKENNVHTMKAQINVLGINIEVRTINEFKKFIFGGIHKKPFYSNFSAQINHYYTRTYNEFVTNKLIRGDVANKEWAKKINVQYFFSTDKKAKFCDYKIFKNLIELKEKIKK